MTEKKRALIGTMAILLAIIGVALVLRLIRLDVSYWIDEILTHRAASLGLGRAATFRYYPLNYVVAHMMLKLGDTESILRLPSVVVGIITVVVMYLWARDVGERRAGLLAAFLLAVWPAHIWLSQDARYYAVYVLAGAMMLWFGALALQSGRLLHWLLFLAAAVLGVLDHVFFVAFLGSASLGGMAWAALSRQVPGGRAKVLRFGALCCCGLAVILVLIGTSVASGSAPDALLKHFTEQDEAKAELLQGDAEPKDVVNLGPEQFRLTLGDYGSFFRRDFCSGASGPTMTLLLGLAILGGVRTVRRMPALASMMAACLMVVPLPFLLWDAPHVFLFRYFTVDIAILVFLVAMGVDGAARFVAERGRERTAAFFARWEAFFKCPKRRKLCFGLTALAVVLLSTTAPYLGAAASLLARIGVLKTPADVPPGVLLAFGPASVACILGALWGMLRFARVRVSRGGDARWRKPFVVWALVVVLLLAALAPWASASLRAYYRQPGWKKWDWKSCSRCMADTLTTDDVIVFFVRAPYLRHMMLPLEHYLERFVPNGPAVVPGLTKYIAMDPELDLVKRVARAHPGSTVWIINRHEGQWTQDLESIDALTEGGIKYGGTVLRFLGEPTRNFIEDGGFESGHAGEGLPDGARITGEGYQSSAGAMVETTQPGFHALSIPVAIPAQELAAGRPFTLSMVLRYDTDILASPRALEREDDAPIGAGVLLSGLGPGGVPFETDVIRLRGRREWRHYAFCLKPGEHFPEGASLLTVQVGVYGGTGAVWVDNVQFEGKDHPTPFIDGVRLPHDEYLARFEQP